MKAVEGGMPVTEAVRHFGAVELQSTIWRKRYAGLEISDVKRLKAREDENRRVKRVVADLTLDKEMLQDVLSRKW